MFDNSNWRIILSKYDDPLTIGNLSETLGITPKMVRKYLKRASVDYMIISRKYLVQKKVWLNHIKMVFSKVGFATPNDMARFMLKLNHMWEAGINPPPPEPSNEEKERLNKKLHECRNIGFREGYARGKKEKTEETVKELIEEGFTERKIAELLNISDNDVKAYLDPETGVILQMPQIG